MAGMIARLTASLRSRFVGDRAIRAESWALGGRHLGDILVGAKLELGKADLPDAKRVLLLAVRRRELAVRRAKLR